MDKGNIEQLRRAAMLQLLQKSQAARRVEPALQAIPLLGRDQALPLSWSQQRLWFLDQLDHAASSAYHLPVALRLSGRLQYDALQATLNAVLDRHEALRTTFVQQGREPVQVIAPPGTPFALESIDLRQHADPESALSAHIASALAQPFDLAQGPLIRGQLLALAADDHVLLLVQHHIISDGWSIGVLVREVTSLYAAFSQASATANDSGAQEEAAKEPASIDPGNLLPPLPLQYADYAAWQRNLLQGEKLAQHIDFWKQHLQGAPALLELPLDFPRPATQSHRGQRHAFKVEAAVAAGLRELARSQDATLFMVLLAGWALLLSRLAMQQEVVIGTPVANRQRKEIEALIGFFVNTLALKVDLGADPSSRQLLQQVKADTLAAYAHQSLPFEQVVEALQPARSLAHSPIFQVMFTLTSGGSGAAAGTLSLPGLSLSQLSLPHDSAHFDLTLEMSDVDGELSASLEYASDLFHQDSIARMLQRFQVLLAGMVATPDLPVSRLPLLDATERHTLMQRFNDTARACPDAPIAPLFEQQAARTPDAPALVYAHADAGNWLAHDLPGASGAPADVDAGTGTGAADTPAHASAAPLAPQHAPAWAKPGADYRSISYAELNARANQLAHHLLACGVQPDQRIAICLERSLDMTIGFLAILKAGAAYVPLDPGYPAERLAHMLSDSEPVAIITESRWLPNLPLNQRAPHDASLGASEHANPHHPASTVNGDSHATGPTSTAPTCTPRLVLLDHDLSAITAHSTANPDTRALGLTPNHLAYVIYTSGSTGLPKGVMVEQRNVVQLVINNPFASITPGDCIAHCANPAFDASTWEIWGALLTGARVLIIPQAVLLDPRRFNRVMVDGGVSATFLTIALFNQYADALAELMPRLNYLLFGGEQADLRKVKHVFQHSKPRHLVHCYGPTETTTFATTLDIVNLTPDATVLPIGAPLGNAHIHILDRHLQPVPIGVTGEIYIGGAGVARGYLKRDDLTQERFIDDPFVAEMTGTIAGKIATEQEKVTPVARVPKLYKTGDLARWLPDGTVEYIGRNDFQVKIRGFRIELGEIENRLVECRGVQEALVIAQNDASTGSKRLAAYLVPKTGVTLDVAFVREQLSGLLPEYMIPAGLIVLEQFPLNVNGKIDRRALPTLDTALLATREYVAPQGDTETTIAAIWQTLLGIERVGRHDHFFELGGHSLLVVGMIEQMREQGLHTDVRTVFANATPAMLASALQTRAQPALAVPPNLIAADCQAITPDMLPLISLTQADIDQIVAATPGGVANVQDIYPLAPLQEGILFHHLLETEGDAYLLRSMISFDTRARLDAFLHGLQCVIARHDILRSAMHWANLPQAVQVVVRQASLPRVEWTLPVSQGEPADGAASTSHLQQPADHAPPAATGDQQSNPGGASSQSSDAAFAYLAQQTDPRHTRLDLRQAPLLAAHTIAGSGGQWHLALLAHHIVCDHVTMEFIMEEIQLVLQARAASLPPSLPYRNFIAQTRAISQEQHEAYFRQQLADIDEPTAPFGLLNVQGNGSAVAEARLPLTPELAQAVRQAARAQGVPAAALFHLAWALVLGQCSGRDDVVFGTVLSGRLQGAEGSDKVLGIFINTLPLRVSLGSLNVADALHATWKAMGELLVHEQASLALAQRCSAVAPGLPLFTSLLNCRHSHVPEVEDQAANAAWEGIRMVAGEERTNYPLTVSVDDLGQGFALSAQAASGIDPARMMAYLERAVATLVAHLDQPAILLDQLTILPPQEHATLLDQFNATARDYPHAAIHTLFEQQAAQTPDAPALVFALDDASNRLAQGVTSHQQTTSGHGSAPAHRRFAEEYTHISYAALNARANQLAHHLLASGVRPDQRIAICLERSLDMTIGFLAILKAGAAYVPLDPGYPAERLAHMLGDSEPVAIITESRWLPNLPLAALAVNLPADDARQTPAPRLVLLDRDLPQILAQSASNPDTQALGLRPEHLAYVIYTSGSTGLPKGVMVEHRNVVQLTVNNPFATITPLDCIAHCANPAFDASTWEIWGALLTGARVLIIPQAVLLDPRRFNRVMVDGGVSATFLTIALFNQYADALAELLPRLNYLLFGGEQADLRKVKHVFQHSKPRHLVHCYGPTETTTFATTQDIVDLSADATMLPIGAPIGNTRIHILDQHLRPVPLGVTGEIHIGGKGVARGYLKRDDLTQERFIADRFADQFADQGSAPRLYKTGDLARWLPDGTIEYIGRNDFQVKIRGFRIELGEIENRLVECSGVKAALVIARQDASTGSKRLVAYLIAAPDVALDIAVVRAELASRVPDYMVPSALLVLEHFPLTANGKINRNALPEADFANQTGRPFEAAHNATEACIIRIWQSLLGLAQIGRHDHFFELGGHSLLVVGMIEKLRQQGLNLDVRTVFNAPTPARLAASLHGASAPAGLQVPANPLSEPHDAITPDLLPLATLTQAEIDSLVGSIPGGAPAVQDVYPLAPLQEGILFHYLLGGEGDAYLLRTVISFDQRAMLDQFLAALQSVIVRHDILRTAIRWQGLAEPHQVVLRSARLPVLECTLRPGMDAMQSLMAASDPRHMRLDLQQAPLLAAHIIHDGAGCHLALLAHHIVCDHVTQDLILAEIQAVLQGQHAQLPPALPYRNFIAHTRSVSAAEHEAYFRQQLGDIDEPTAPFGVLDVHNEGDGVAEARTPLAPALAARVRALAREHGMPAAVLFHLAFGKVLAQCSGRDDVVFGTVLSGRMQGSEGADQVMGLFINTLPLRLSLGRGSIADALRATWQSMGDLLVHEQASLALAQRCSGLAPNQPLFTALFNYRHSMAETHNDAGADGHTSVWEGMRLQAGEERSNYPITFSVDDLGQDFYLSAQCVAGIAPERLIRYVESALEQISAGLLASSSNVAAMADGVLAQAGDLAWSQAERKAHGIAELSILPETERQWLVQGLNQTACPFPGQRLIQQVFETQVARHPAAIALQEGEYSLSYDALNQRANQLAHHLLALGVQPDDTVALCLPRSSTMVMAMLAVLKAGAAYLPLDPAHPAERLAHMVADAAPRVMLSDTAHSAMASLACQGSDLPPAQVVLERDAQVLAQQALSNPHVPACSARNLAYVMYTSGSTGTPKGVMVEHRSVLRLVINNHYAPLTERDCVAHCANPAFDAATWEIWGALLTGARLLVVPHSVVLDPVALNHTLHANRVSALWLTVGLFNACLEQLGPTFGQLRYLLIGGDALDPRRVAQLQASRHAPQQVINGYGPTETTTFAATYAIPKNLDPARPIPIGKPIANTRIHILDRHLQVVPQGVVGELYIGGPGVARGYLNRPDLTAERFIADPFASEFSAEFSAEFSSDHGNAGNTLYRTGDLARWNADGQIEYLGRNDHQVKLRGYRIELSEIEAQLLALPGVEQALVLAQDAPGASNPAGEKRLVAWVIRAPGQTLCAATLRQQLAAVLPTYMLPGAFVQLDTWPLTANGKVDRRALPQPDQTALVLRPWQSPEGELEEAIAAIWSDLLGAEMIGRDDHFFELGGHSLLAVQMLARLRQTLGHEVALRQLFAHPTLQSFARAIATATGLHPNLVPLRPLASPGTGAPAAAPLFLIHPGEGEVGYARDLAPWIDADVALYALAASGLAKGETALSSVPAMATLYIDAIRRVQPHGPYRLAGWSAGGTIAYEMAQQLIKANEVVQFVGLIDTVADYRSLPAPDHTHGPFNPVAELLWRLPANLPIALRGTLDALAQANDLAAMLIQAQQAGLLPPEIDADTLQRHLAVAHGIRAGLWAYQPEPFAASVPVSLFVAREQPHADPHLGWDALATLCITKVAGDHQSMMSSQHIGQLGVALSAALAHTTQHGAGAQAHTGASAGDPASAPSARGQA